MIETSPQQVHKISSVEPDPNIEQNRASDPLSSVWVGASAGTGKTKVLTDRVLRLMLPRPDLGVESATPPERILCITFTKAAAAEMLDRINKTLSNWAVMGDDDKNDMNEKGLKTRLRELTGVEPDTEMLNAARRLFARVVDVPGGMKVMTIHSFCQSVLKRFPLEAGLPPHFELMDDRTSSEYMTYAQHSVIRRVLADTDSQLYTDLHHLTQMMQIDDMNKLMADIAKERVRLAKILRNYGGYDGLVDNIYNMLDVQLTDTVETILMESGTISQSVESHLRECCTMLAEGTKTDIARSDVMQNWLNADIGKRASTFLLYKKAYLTAKDTILAKFATVKIIDKKPDIVDIMMREAERVLDILDKKRRFEVAKSSAVLFNVADEILGSYRQYKELKGLLDYDDLIYQCSDLLNREGQAAWVLYKLDRGVDHVLVDEAQDTNPEQWQVISAIVKEFFAGEGARDDVTRTVFVVGDEKQSIYSFNRADPIKFNEMLHYFENMVTGAEGNWQKIDMKVSFRSVPAILEVVDTIFSNEQNKKGVVFEAEQDVEHIPFRKLQAGLVELWPLNSGGQIEKIETWQMPEIQKRSELSTTSLTDRIADTIQSWLKNGDTLEASGRKISAGDIMILVRTRNVFVEQMVRALKMRKIPVSGVDRMVVNEQLPVMDLLVLADFLLLPSDDLTLATLLKTPLIGMSEEDLFELSYNRKGNLWNNVKDNADKEISNYLGDLLKYMRSSSPYDLFSTVLNKPCPADNISARRAFLTRLGHDALDALDEILNACLEFEKLHVPSLQLFMHWFSTGQGDIKRQQDNTDQVRIMTVHGSKGLQAPIVFLPDTIRKPLDRTRLLWSDDDKFPPLWVPSKDMSPNMCDDIFAIEKEKTEQEYKRLLYVALTRAEDRLYIAGAKTGKSTPKGCWYTIIEESLDGIAAELDFVIDGKPVIDVESKETLKIKRFVHGEVKKSEEKITEIKLKSEPLPDWARQEPKAEPLPPKPLTPSRPSEEEPAMRAPLNIDDGDRFKRGILVHQLLEILPEIESEYWEKAALTFLSRPCHDLTLEYQKNLIAEVLEVLNHPKFTEIFGEDSKAEVPVVGLISQMKAVDMQILSGYIDRMVVRENDVLIIDYKTNRPPPTQEKDVAEIYLKQMASYRTAIKEIYPDKDIKCALLWTDGPFLMDLSSEILDDYVL